MGRMLSNLRFLVLYLAVKLSRCEIVNILAINDIRNDLANKAVAAAKDYLNRNERHGVQIEELATVHNDGDDGQQFLDKICGVYQQMWEQKKLPQLVIDLTHAGTVSEAAKTFSQALALPTVATAYGQEQDIRTWRDLDAEQLKYLIQVSPPDDIAPEVVRSLVIYQNLTNAAVIFDKSYEMDHKYKSLLRNLPTRHMLVRVEKPDAIQDQLRRLRNLDIVNFFILGNLTTVKSVLDSAALNDYFNKKFAWYIITLEEDRVMCKCKNASVLVLRPKMTDEAVRHLNNLQTAYSLVKQPRTLAAFYFDIVVRSVLALKLMSTNNELHQNNSYSSCEDYNEAFPPRRVGFNFRKYFTEVEYPVTVGPLFMDGNGKSFMKFSMDIEKIHFINSQVVSQQKVGSWSAGLHRPISVNNDQIISNFSAVQVLRVVTVLQEPFMMYDPVTEQYSGYCMDLLKMISVQVGFEYEVYIAPDNDFGYMNYKGEWSGMIGELLNKKADIALSSLYVTAERENVIDFTVPYYDLVGITILMKKPFIPTSLFKFLSVLENEVWLCILATYFFSSFFMWGLDRFSPYSYRNNSEQYKDDDEQRDFTLRECLWFCMTSLTPQGGGESPKNISGRIIAATWWLFGFIIIASYTANLAAFLTVSRLDIPVESLDELSKQYKIQYAPLNNSWVQTYFRRMADIEKRFYDIWKKMSLNSSQSARQRAQLAVWDYPISDRYSKMWRSMQKAGFPATLDEAVERVLESKSTSEGFAFLGDAIDIKYQSLTKCQLQMVGDEFSRKPFAIAVQQGSPLKDTLNNAILYLLNKRQLEQLKTTWWNNNPKKVTCEKTQDQTEGISIENIGGVFIVIFVGIGIACVTLAFEYWWMKYKKPKEEMETRSESDMFQQRRKWSKQIQDTHISPMPYSDNSLSKENKPYRRKEHNRW